MRLASPFRAELNQVVIPLTVRNQPNQLQQLTPFAEHLRIEANALDKQIDPFIGSELLPGLYIAIEIKMGFWFESQFESCRMTSEKVLR